MANAKQTRGAVGALLGLGVAGYWWFFGQHHVETQVAEDAVAQYEIAKQQGDPMQTCVQAMGVSAAWLQAKDSAKYQAAKWTEKMDCQRAGMSR